jgi:hypothetical protein
MFKVSDAEMAKMIGQLQEIGMQAATYKAERDSLQRENDFLRSLLRPVADTRKEEA